MIDLLIQTYSCPNMLHNSIVLISERASKHPRPIAVSFQVFFKNGHQFPAQFIHELFNIKQLLNDTKAEFNNCFDYLFKITPSLKSSENMLTSIDVKDVKEMKGCSASQTFSKWRMSSFELSSCCSCYVFSQ